MVGALVAAGVGIVLGLLFMPKSSKAKSSNAAPATLDSFSVSTTDEGAVVPLVFGRVRINTNILFYGNLRTEAIYTTSKGGKGGSKKVKTLTGYQYYLDIWHGIARGPIKIVGMYADDKVVSLSGYDYNFNDGSGSYYPARAGEFATKLPGIAHIYFTQYALSENSTQVPTLHFIVEDTNTVPFTNARLDTGINPAAAVYLLLTEAGATTSQFDLTGFQLAANRYAALGYGLNITFGQRQKTRDCIESVLNYAGGVLVETQTESGSVFNLKVPSAADSVAATLSDDDYASFKMERTGQDKMPNVFTAKYTDEEQEYSQRVIICKNTAAVAQSGRIDKSIDLTAFRNCTSAQKRLAELLRNLSFPGASFVFELGLKYSRLEIGDLVAISHSEWGVSGLKARITTKEMPGPEGSTYSFQAELDPLFTQDATFTVPAYSPQWKQPDYTPQNLTKVKLFELPRTPYNNDTPALAVLAARQTGVETGFGVLWSAASTDYEILGQCATYCQVGYLSGAYSADTYDVDDATGLTYTPWREDPEFESVSRANLFNFRRLALVDNEIMSFQGVELLADGKIKLSGIVRGAFGTVKVAHANNAEIWLIPAQDDIFFSGLAKSGTLKLLPFFGAATLAEGDATAKTYTLTNKAVTPFSVGRIEAVRSGAEVSINWWPRDVDPYGAGVKSEDYSDQYPFIYSGDFMYRIGTSGDYTALSAASLQISRTGAFTISIMARQNGALSSVKSLTVGAADGTYTI